MYLIEAESSRTHCHRDLVAYLCSPGSCHSIEQWCRLSTCRIPCPVARGGGNSCQACSEACQTACFLALGDLLSFNCRSTNWDVFVPAHIPLVLAHNFSFLLALHWRPSVWPFVNLSLSILPLPRRGEPSVIDLWERRRLCECHYLGRILF